MAQPIGEAPSDMSLSDASPSAGFVQVEAESSPSVRSFNTDTYQFELSSSSDVDKCPESVEGADSDEVSLNSERDVVRSPDDADNVDSCSDEKPDMMVLGDTCTESDFDDHAVPDGDLSGDESECSNIWDDENDTAFSNHFMGALVHPQIDPLMEKMKVMEIAQIRAMIDILMLLCALILLLCASILLLDAVQIVEEIETAEAKLLKPSVGNAQAIGSGAGISIFFVALIGAAFFTRNRWVRRYNKGAL